MNVPQSVQGRIDELRGMIDDINNECVSLAAQISEIECTIKDRRETQAGMLSERDALRFAIDAFMAEEQTVITVHAAPRVVAAPGS